MYTDKAGVECESHTRWATLINGRIHFIIIELKFVREIRTNIFASKRLEEVLLHCVNNVYIFLHRGDGFIHI